MPPETPSVFIIDLAKYYGGADVRVVELARALHPQHRVTVATLSGSPVQQRLESAGVTVLPVTTGRSNPRTAWTLARAIRQGGFDVIDAHNPQSQFWGHWGGLFGRRVRRVSTIHSAYRLEHGGNLKGRLYEQVLHLNRWQGCHFIAVTEAVEQYLHSVGLPPDRVSLIHNSIAQPPPPDTAPVRALFDRLGWDEDAFILIIVARLEPVKEHATLINAVRQVAPDHPRLRCLIVGDGRLREPLEAQTSAAGLDGRVHFAGFRDDIPALLASSDAFCLPSQSEGLPYALLEAALYRLPLLVSEVGGMAELLTHQETGYFVPPGDADALAGGLRWLLAHPDAARAMGQAAFELVHHKFDPAVTLRETLAVYRG